MLFSEHLVVVRGGGDLGTGVVLRLHRAGFPLIVLELPEPLAIRRTVAVSSAVAAGRVTVEDLEARRVESIAAAGDVAESGTVAVVVAAGIPDGLGARLAVVDARLAKRNLDTRIDDAPLVVGLGPGLTAGRDCHAVVETMRGHHLGRVLWTGTAAPNTGEPGMVGGASSQRVVRAPVAGRVTWEVVIGDLVRASQPIGLVGEVPIVAPIDGVVRGLISDGIDAWPGLKVADIDPRGEAAACFEVSDKALAIGGGALEAVLTHLNRTT